MAVRGFGEVSYRSDSYEGDGGDQEFAIGPIDFFVISEINDHLSFLLETDFLIGIYQ